MVQKEFKLTKQWIANKYDELNAKCFYGKLFHSASPFMDFKVTKSMKRAGETLVYHMNVTVGLSSNACYTEKNAVNTLLHEMIHVEQAMNGMVQPESTDEELHGAFFMQESERINAIGYNVSRVFMGEVKRTSKPMKIYLFTDSRSGKRYATRVSDKTKDLVEMVFRFNKQLTNVAYCETTCPKCRLFPLQKINSIIKRFSAIMIDTETEEKILKEAVNRN